MGLVTTDHQLAALPESARERCDRGSAMGTGCMLETASPPGGQPHQRALLRHPGRRRWRPADVPGASMETKGLFAYVLPQAVL